MKELKNQRRSKKALMTRNLNMLNATLKEEEADVDCVLELLNKSQEAFEQVEAAHQRLGELLDDASFEVEEQWMESSQEAFWKVKSLARKFLAKHKPVNEVNQVTNVSSTGSSSSGLNELKLALELPKAEILEFSGNPVDYWSFINNFKINVSAKLSNDNTRLQYLIQLCKGKARTCIDSCPLMETGGYDKALDILKKQFGQPHIILSALMDDLLHRKQINIGDGEALWSLVSVMKKCNVTLTQMGYTSDLNSTANLLKVQSLLPTVLQNKWANVAHDILEKGEPTFLDMLNFVEKQAEVSCNMFGRSVGKGSVGRVSLEKPKVRSNAFNTTKTVSCFACNDNHKIFVCKKFIDMTYNDKVETVRSKRLCFRCLMPGHISSKCRREAECKTCKSTKHHDMLHPPERVKSYAAISGRNVYLMTVPVEVVAANGNKVKTLALLDNGSDSSLCSEALRKKLGVAGQRIRYTASTVNGEEDKVGFSFEVNVSGALERNEMSLKVLTVDSVPANKEAIPTCEELNTWHHLKGLSLGVDRSLNVDLLIGADTPEAFWVLEEKRGKPKEPYAVRTPLGWGVIGPGNAMKKRMISNRISVTSVSNEQLMQQLQLTWELDNTGFEVEEDSVEDQRAREILSTTTVHQDSGHYQMGLLWKYNEHPLPCNRPMAEIRLESLKRKLNKDEALKQKYIETVNSYISKGHAELVEDAKGKKGNIWYLPHHPVTHPRKPDKVRVVFDCAAKWKGVSLNDNLLKGPEVTSNLVGVLLRFRQEKIALVADIEAMFHQVQVIPIDRDVLRFLWWEGGNTKNPPKEYRMTVHVFGATSSPCCAGYALRRTADDNHRDQMDETGKRAVDVIRSGFYVDDCLTSIRETEEAIKLAQRLQGMLKEGGFRLTKWLSSDRQVLNCISESERAPSVPVSLDQLPTERTLGVCWDANLDNFKFEVEIKDKPTTRRGLLSVTSSIYDPLGFAAPFVLHAKSLLQTVCRRGTEWDENLGEKEVEIWDQWKAAIPNLTDVKVPRWMKLEEAVNIQLHVFCDASEKGYAAVAYFRTVSRSNTVDVTFAIGKARVSPLKQVSIPRLELLGAALAVKLDGIVRREIDSRFELAETTYWCDSTIVLGYINNETKRFKTFVANRVAKIRGVSQPHQWRHVKSEDNSADEGSRGTLQMSTWIVGPQFLLSSEENWPKMQIADITGDPEVKINTYATQTRIKNQKNTVLDELTEKISSWTRLIRVYAFVRRFIARCKRTTDDRLASLSVAEIQGSEMSIIAWMQRSEFARWESDQRLKSFQPVLMGDVLRVGGRIDRSKAKETMKHPIILPAYTNVSKLIIRHYHKVVGHGGWMSTLNALRQKFWLLKGRTAVRSALSKCVTCKRYGGRPAQQLMAELPAERLDDGTPPFTNVGVDFFGPFEVKAGRSTVKRYGCIFTCLVSRAVHLELASSLDTDAFINALRRFVARRGQPKMFVSDNGTNIHGGERELRETIQRMKEKQIEEFCHTKGFEWKFNPAHASHFGGAWERLIRSVRRILNGVLREQRLTEDVLCTALTEVESILNSRPLTDISQDPLDDEPLTPNHLLLLRQGPSAPVENTDKSWSYSKKRWLQVQYLASLFWTRWRKEYLPLLQKRNKWTTPKENVMVNDVVLLVDEMSPRGKWQLGRVLAVRSSKDGKVRSVDVKVNNNVLKRPIAKLCIVYRSSIANS